MFLAFRNFIHQRPVFSAALLVVLSVLFSHLPFYIYIPLPGISMDTFQYFWMAKMVQEGRLPLPPHPTQVPWGYPLFLAACRVFHLNILGITMVQTIIYTISAIVLIFCLARYSHISAWIAATGIMLFTVQPHTLRHNFFLYSESLYTSFLMLTVAAAIFFLNRKSYAAFFVLSLSAFATMWIRPNCVVNILIPLFGMILGAKSKKRLFRFGLIFFGVVLIGMVINFIIKGKFSPIDFSRFKSVFLYAKERMTDPNYIRKYENDTTGYIPTTTAHRLKKYCLSFVEPKTSFYYSLMKTNYDLIVNQKMPEDTSLRMFDGEYKMETFSPGLRDYIFKGFNYKGLDDIKYRTVIDYNQPKNFWIYAVHLAYEICNKSKFTYIILFSFWALLVINLILWFLKAQELKHIMPLFSVAYIYISSLLVLPIVHGSYQLRYIHVTEFSVFVLGIYALFVFILRLKQLIKHLS
ncbi:MAG: hypothetical protein RMJ53_02280 [Chitinophagales bacterium]|nr:hypothetical protein [Chitinophagales bacterium]MDW8273038.1 hypothetical protein [Chitinophagales bacterium]